MSTLATGRGGGSASAAAPCRSPPSRGPPPRPLRTRRVGAVRAAPPARGDQPAAEGGGEGPGQPTGVRRRELLGASLASLAALQGGRAPARAEAAESARALELEGRSQVGLSRGGGGGVTMPDYTGPGPFQPARLPRLEHTCSSCFPQCVGDKCRLRIDVTYPKGAISQGYNPPFPLAIITSGFLVPAENYTSYARRLASWGYVVLQYDKTETVGDSLDDVLSVQMIRELIDWAETDPSLRQCADTERVYLCGHSRGGKLSTLAAIDDNRVAALCLIDPVDNTVYAPLGPRCPSAVAGLGNLERERYSGRMQRPLPMAVIGSGLGADCAPPEANYRHFYDASSSPAWEVVLKDTGHFQFVDNPALLFRSFCTEGPEPDDAVRCVTQAVMVAWGETMVKGRRGLSCRTTRQGAEGGAACADEGDADEGAGGAGLNIQGLDIIKGYPNLELASLLFETQGAASRVLHSGGYQQGVATQLTSRLKGFSLS